MFDNVEDQPASGSVKGRPAKGKPELAARVDTNHFELLDGLRGIAAICVFFYHSGNHAYAANGFLAVDFFFMLSGFVVAHAYEARLSSGAMSLREFAYRRFARLYPMVLVGVVLGALVLVAHNVADRTEAYDGPSMGAWIVSALAVLPYLAPNPFLNAVFPVNVVLWSLFLELLANLAYAVGVRHISTRILVLLVVGGLLGVWLGGHIDGGGSLETFWIGFARVAAGFATGILLFRLRRDGLLPRLSGGLLVTSLALFVLTFLPPIVSPLWLPLVYVLFAATIILALNVRDIDRRTFWLCRMLGIVSYPLYLIHRPVTALTVGFGKMVIPLSPATYPLFVAIALVLSIGISLAVERFYERRVRRIMTRMLLGARVPVMRGTIKSDV